jgi:hypothetical protein
MIALNITHLSKISIQLVVVIYQIDGRSCCPGAGVWQRARKPFSKAEGHTMTRPEATLPTNKSSVFDCGKILSVTNLNNINAIA